MEDLAVGGCYFRAVGVYWVCVCVWVVFFFFYLSPKRRRQGEQENRNRSRCMDRWGCMKRAGKQGRGEIVGVEWSGVYSEWSQAHEGCGGVWQPRQP